MWLQMSMSATSSSLLEKFYIHLNVRRNNFDLIKSLEPFSVITLRPGLTRQLHFIWFSRETSCRTSRIDKLRELVLVIAWSLSQGSSIDRPIRIEQFFNFFCLFIVM